MPFSLRILCTIWSCSSDSRSPTEAPSANEVMMTLAILLGELSAVDLI
jgi:hypothetical protein